MDAGAQELCSEFSRNFSVLERKYAALEQQLEFERKKTAEQEKGREAAERKLHKANEEIAALKKDLDDAGQFKERFYASSVAMEHLKGRLEGARKAVADKEMEHQHEVDQLRAQMRDLLQRIETSADLTAVSALRAQRTELEERCAALTAQLLEEKERGGQQQISTNTALRDVQSRNMELQQRCRVLEADAHQLRTQQRRAVDAQNEVTLERERLLLEHQRLELECEGLRRELAQVRAHHNEAEQQREQQSLEKERGFEKEKDQWLRRVQEAGAQLDAVMAQRAAETEKHAALQRTVQARVLAARDESHAEVEALQQAKAEVIEELQRAKWRLKQSDQRGEELRLSLSQAEQRIASLEQQRHQLQGQVEAAVQQEAWTAAERERLQQQVQLLQQRADEASAEAKAHESVTLELERVKMKSAYADADLVEARKALERQAAQLRNVESMYESKAKVAASNAKAMKVAFKQQMAKLEAHRKKLAAASMQKDHEIMTLRNQFGGGGMMSTQPAGAPLTSSVDGGVDALALLKSQNEMATMVSKSLTQLRHQE